MISFLNELLSYEFIRKAIIVGGLVSLCAALLGVSLVLKRYSMIGDGLSHVGFGALTVAIAMNLTPLQIALPTVLLAAFFLLRISENRKINGDAAIALISSTSVAIGVLVTSMTTGMNTDVSAYLFGSVFALTKNDVYLSVVFSVAVIFLYLLFYNRIFSVTFDESFARATGVKAGRYNMLIAGLTALIVVVGMRIMGTLLISALIIFPALTSMRLFKSFKTVIFSSAVVSLVCFFAGILGSFLFSSPPGATVVVVNFVLFLLFGLISIFKNKLKKDG